MHFTLGLRKTNYAFKTLAVLLLAHTLSLTSDAATGSSRAWHQVEGVYPRVLGAHLPRGEARRSITVLVDGAPVRLSFALQDVRTPQDQLERAGVFYQMHLAGVAKFLGETDADGTLRELEHIPGTAASVIKEIAARIRREVEKSDNVFAVGSLAVRRRWFGGDFLLYNRAARTVAPHLERFGEWETRAVRLLASLLRARKGGVVIDAGAHFGLFTLAMQHLLPGMTYHAFEPQRALHNILCANIALRGAERSIIAHSIALASRKELLHVPVLNRPGNLNAGWSNFAGVSLLSKYRSVETRSDGTAGDTPETYQVQGIDLSSLVFPEDEGISVSIACPRLFKIDVEGFEMRVLQGAAGMFERGCLPILYFEMNSWPHCSRRYVEFLAAFGYSECYHHIFDYVSEDNWAGEADEAKTWKGVSFSSNVLCFPSGADAGEKRTEEMQAEIAAGRLIRIDERSMGRGERICDMPTDKCGRVGGYEDHELEC